jgi:hypothetical protein
MNPITAFVLWLTTNLYWLTGAVFAFLAAYAFLTFLRGFLLGLNHLFYIDSNEEHVGHARDHVAIGFIALVNLFVIWVNIKIVVAFLGFDTANVPLGFAIDLFYVVFWLLYRLYGQIEEKTKLK